MRRGALPRFGCDRRAAGARVDDRRDDVGLALELEREGARQRPGITGVGEDVGVDDQRRAADRRRTRGPGGPLPPGGVGEDDAVADRRELDGVARAVGESADRRARRRDDRRGAAVGACGITALVAVGGRAGDRGKRVDRQGPRRRGQGEHRGGRAPSVRASRSDVAGGRVGIGGAVADGGQIDWVRGAADEAGDRGAGGRDGDGGPAVDVPAWSQTW